MTPLANLNGLVCFAERRNLVSARVPSRFKRCLLFAHCRYPFAHSKYVCTCQIYVCAFKISICLFQIWVGRDSSVGITTLYGLDGPGIENSTPVQTGPVAHPASSTMGTGSFPGVKRPGRGVDHPPAYSADVKERVELYLYSRSGSSWPALGWTLRLPLFQISIRTF